MGVLFFVLLLISIGSLYSMRDSNSPPQWDKYSVAFALAMASPVLAVLFSQFYHGSFSARPYDGASRFLFAIPMFFALRQRNIRIVAAMQLGIPLGVFVGFVALKLHPFDWGGRYTTSEFFNLIHFSDTALILGFLSLFSINSLRKDHALLCLFKIFAFLLGIYMSIQSGERGGWLAIPPLLLIWVFYQSKEKIWLKLTITTVLILCAAWLSYFMLDVVHSRVNSIFDDLNNFFHGNKDTSLGIRLQHWQAALYLFAGHPFFGVGPDQFEKIIPELEAMGMLTPLAAKIGHSELHNEILAKCTETGLFGFASILSVFIVPLFIFKQTIRSPHDAVRIASVMGVCLVSGFFIFGLTVEIFNLKMTASFFALTLALLMASATNKSIR